MSTERLALFTSLLETAFKSLAKATPTVVIMGDDDDSGSVLGNWSQTFPWPRRVVGSPSDMPALTTELLHEGPVLLLPPWESLPDKAGSRNLWQHEKILLDCGPPSADFPLATIIPVISMTSSRARQFRQTLAERWQEILITYSSNIFPEIHPSTQFATVFLCTRQDNLSPLRFFQMPAGADSEAVQADFRRLLTTGGGRGRFGFVLREHPAPGESLGFERHDPHLLDRRSALAGFGVTVQLGEMFERIPSAFNSIARRDLVREIYDPSAVRILSGRDLRRDGTIAAPDEEGTWAEIPFEQQLRVGDVLIPNVFRGTDSGGLIAVAVTEEDFPVAAGERIVALRPIASLNPEQLRFVLQYLRSPLAKALMVGLSTSLHVQWSALSQLPIPKPDDALATALHDLAEAAKRFEEWHFDAESVLDSVFLDEDVNAARARIVRSGRTLRLRAEAASLLDDYRYAVRTTYPYPIAYRWREVEAAVSAGESSDAYKAIIDTFEVLLCYIASLALALSQSAAIRIGHVNQMRIELSSGRGGLGLGDWVAVLEEVRDGRSFRRLPDSEPLHEIRSFLAEQDRKAAKQRLYERRNDRSHLRDPDSVDLPRAVPDAFADLTTLITAASFLSDLPLVVIDSVQWDNYQERSKIDYRELMGDHPIVPTSTRFYPGSKLEVGSLYVMDQQHKLHLLRPFLTGQICPTCRTWSTFHVDRIIDDDLALKSLEHGHSIQNSSLIPALRVVGLL